MRYVDRSQAAKMLDKLTMMNLIVLHSKATGPVLLGRYKDCFLRRHRCLVK